MQDRLTSVRQIQASDEAFAAVLIDGSVITWGDKHYGGDSSSVQDQLKNVHQIQASGSAFAADSSSVQDPAKERATDPSLRWSFCRPPRRWSVIARGDKRYGGDSISVQDQLKNF